MTVRSERDPEEVEARMDELLSDLERMAGNEEQWDQLASEHRDLVWKQTESNE
jgi:hypothetical protein